MCLLASCFKRSHRGLWLGFRDRGPFRVLGFTVTLQKLWSSCSDRLALGGNCDRGSGLHIRKHVKITPSRPVEKPFGSLIGSGSRTFGRLYKGFYAGLMGLCWTSKDFKGCTFCCSSWDCRSAKNIGNITDDTCLPTYIHAYIYAYVWTDR